MTDLLSVSVPPDAPGLLRPLEVTVLVRDDVVPWRYPALRQLQFGEWLREDVQAGIVEPAMPDHDLAILPTKVRQHSVGLVGPPAAALFDEMPRGDLSRALLDTVAQWTDASDWQGDARNVVLALACIWFSAVTGGIASKEAAAWGLERLPEAHQPVLAKARSAYLGNAREDLADQAEGVATFVRHARAEIERVG